MKAEHSEYEAILDENRRIKIENQKLNDELEDVQLRTFEEQ